MGPVVQLAEIDPDAGLGLGEVGGKALNLGIADSAGFPVPTGFCVTHRRLRRGGGRPARRGHRRAARHGLRRPGHRSAAGRAGASAGCPSTGAGPASPPDPSRVRAAAASGAGSGPVLGDGRRPGVRQLRRPAGHLPQCRRRDAVIDAVRRCWASLWTDRAVSYRTSQRHRPAHGSPWRSSCSGWWTRSQPGSCSPPNPVTGTRHQAVIDASPGLGEAVVSGAVNPDHFVVDTATGAIIERRLGDKRVLDPQPRPGGGTEQVDLDAAVDSACLTDDQLRDLAALGRRVEDTTGRRRTPSGRSTPPGTCWLTQARPITTLYPLPTRPDAARNPGLHVPDAWPRG